MTEVVSVKNAVRRLCARDVVCARIIESDAKQTGNIECDKLLRRLTNGKARFYCCCHRTSLVLWLLLLLLA